MTTARPSGRFPTYGLLAASALATAGVALASLDASVDFRPYFAGMPPVVAALCICLAGVVALKWLYERFAFRVAPTRLRWQEFAVSAAAAVPFMALVTALDWAYPFPADINVPLPTALVFYPAIGFVAQLLLHVIPLLLSLAALSAVFGSWSLPTRLWISIALAALPEAFFQMTATLTRGGDALPRGLLVALHLFLFGLAELHLFRRFSFVHMYAFRLNYYAYWHIVWGSLRVAWLVPAAAG